MHFYSHPRKKFPRPAPWCALARQPQPHPSLSPTPSSPRYSNPSGTAYREIHGPCKIFVDGATGDESTLPPLASLLHIFLRLFSRFLHRQQGSRTNGWLIPVALSPKPGPLKMPSVQCTPLHLRKDTTILSFQDTPYSVGPLSPLTRYSKPPSGTLTYDQCPCCAPHHCCNGVGTPKYKNSVCRNGCCCAEVISRCYPREQLSCMQSTLCVIG